MRAVNLELLSLYWDIGRLIGERQQGETWGRAVVENLAKDLRAEFPGVGGFSAANLWRIKQFYEAYAKDEKLAPLVREISWTKNLVILEQCKDSAERQFYLERTKQFGWTKNVLIHQIENKTFEKTLLNQTNFEVALPEHIRNQAKLAVKDEYTFDFLELADEHSERQLEQAILARVEPFLLEMGGMFSFVGSQYRLEVGGKEYFIDLLLFHRRLRLAADDGAYVFVNLPLGNYIVDASAPELKLPQTQKISLKAGSQQLNLRLQVASTSQQVTVRDNAGAAVSTDPASNAGALVLRGDDLQALSDDPDDLAADLQALAGPSAGPNGG